jgi:tetratricopeptide (TPR) repeat protein
MEEQTKHNPPDSAGSGGLAGGLAGGHAASFGVDEGAKLLDQGRLYYGQGEYNEALSCLHLSYDQFKADGERAQVAEVANDIGVVYTVMERWGEAEKWLDEAQRLFVRVGDYDGEAQTLGNMGSMYRAKGDLQQASAYLQLSGDRFHLVGDDERRAATLRSLSAVRLRQLRPLQALAAYQVALACEPHPTLLQKWLRKLFNLPSGLARQ